MKTLPRVRRARTAEMADFLELSSYKYTWSAEMCRFSKIEKSSKSLHPNLHVQYLYLLYIPLDKILLAKCALRAHAREPKFSIEFQILEHLVQAKISTSYILA